MISAGFYEKGKLEGLAKLYLPNRDMFEGIFNNGKISGKGFYYNSLTKTYTHGIFNDGKVSNEINTYTSYPSLPIKKFKQTCHEGSLNYYSS